MKPLISILIPVYNVELYIEKCLHSLFANTIIDKCEIIIVDDCSPDNSVVIIERLLEENIIMKDRVVLLHHEKNRGLAASRNTAFDRAQGKYFICVDSDDWVEPNYLEELYNKAEEDNSDIVGCDLFSEYYNKTFVKTQPISSDNLQCLKDMYSVKINGWLWIKLIKRELLLKNNIRWIEGKNILEDLIIMTKCFFYSKKTSYVNKPLYHYNHNTNSYMGSLMTITKSNELVSALYEVERFLYEKGQKDLIEILKIQKLHLKLRLLFKGNKEVRKKYLTLWPEANSQLYAFKTSKIRKIILYYSINNPKIASFLLFILCVVKRILGNNLFIKNNRIS